MYKKLQLASQLLQVLINGSSSQTQVYRYRRVQLLYSYSKVQGESSNWLQQPLYVIYLICNYGLLDDSAHIDTYTCHTLPWRVAWPGAYTARDERPAPEKGPGIRNQQLYSYRLLKLTFCRTGDYVAYTTIKSGLVGRLCCK